MKQADLAKRIRVSSSRLSNWENGDHDPSDMEALNRIADALEVSSKWLLTGESDALRSGTGVQLPRTKPELSGKIKLYGRIGANPHGNTSYIDSDEIDVPHELSREDYGGLVVEGDSMLPFLHPSDIVIFRDWPAEKIGHVMAAQLDDGDWVVKLLVYEDGAFRLRSINGRYPDVTDGYRLAGFLVGIVRDDGPERLIRLNRYGLKPDPEKDFSN